MTLDAIISGFNLLTRPISFLFYYFRENPQIELSLEEDGSSQSGRLPGRIYLRWERKFVLHNNSSNLIGGIKLLKSFALPWRMLGNFPAKLDPYESSRVQIVAEIEKDLDVLINRFGEQRKRELAMCLFPEIIANISLEFEFKNRNGRRIYQYSKFLEDGSVKSKIMHEKHKP